MAQASLASGNVPKSEIDALRVRIAALEERWSSDVESGKGGTVLTGGSRTGDEYGPSSQYMASMVQYMSQGNAYRIANPGPFGLYAFAYTTALFQGPVTKWTEEGTNNLLYCYGLFVGGLIQFLAGMWEVYRNNMFGATAFTCFGGFWLGYAIFGILVGGGVLEAPETYTHGVQMYLIIWGILAFTFFLATLAINIALQILLFSLTITLFLLAAGEGGNPNVTKASGYFGIWTSAVAWYIATAELLNSVFRRKILPLGVINIATMEPLLTGISRPDTL